MGTAGFNLSFSVLREIRIVETRFRARWAFILAFILASVLSAGAGETQPELLLEKETFSYYGSPVVADGDNDGDNELLSSVSLWFENCKNGVEVVKYDWGDCYGQTYCPTWRAGIPIEQSGSVAIAVGDLDLDPGNELVIANTTPHDVNSDGRLTIWDHTGGDDFDSCWSVTVGEHVADLAIGDCDHDGENELVVSYTYYWRGFKIYDRVGECQYTESFSHVTGKDNHSVTIADCDNDDSLEIIITPSVWGTEVCIWEYRDGSYQEVWSYPLDTGSPYTLGATATVGDIDNDGHNEILVTTCCGDPASGVYKFEHTVGDTYELAWADTGSDKGSGNPIIADILNDGDNEFLFWRNEQLLVCSDTGLSYDTLVVQQLPDETHGTGSNAIHVGDADNDGNNEVIVGGNTILAYEGNVWICGDINGDEDVNLSDVVYFINYLFRDGDLPQCPPEPYISCADANGDGEVGLPDIVYLINYVLKSGPPPIC